MPVHQDPGTIILEDGRFKFAIHPELLWNSIRTALVCFLDGDKGSMSKVLLDGLGSFSKTSSVEHKAYRLLYIALRKSCVAILTEGPEQERLMEKIQKEGLRTTVFQWEMSQKLGSGNYVIDAGFFAEPHRADLLKDAREDFTTFLQTVVGLEEEHANALAAVLPRKFAKELAYEWDQADYSGLLEVFKNPFLESLKKSAIQEARHAALLQRFAKPAFNDPRVTLAEMYIEPEFWVHGRCLADEVKVNFEALEDKSERHHFLRHKEHRKLHTYFLEWIKRETPLGLKGEKERLMVLLGHPGQGKTSFSLRTIDQLLREHPDVVDTVYLIRLRDITAVEKLLTEPLRTLREQPGMRVPGTEYLPEKELRNSLLLLDGLDELYMNKGLTLDQIQEFVRRLRQDMKNLDMPDFRVVLTSRTNYLKLDGHSDGDYPVLHLAELSLEQQQEWLRRYKRHHPGIHLTEEKLAEIDQKGNNALAKIRELVNQPILLQMIATAEVDIDEKSNSALIYERMFTRLIERDWSEDKQLPKYEKLSVKDMRRFLRTLAIHIFQKPVGQEYARRTDFEDRDTKLYGVVTELARKMEMEALPLKDFSRNLMVSAYFQEVERETEEKRRTGDHEEYAYEFLHKSLQEYLVAEHIWDECQRFFLKKEDDERFEVQTAEQVMAKLHPLFAPKILTDEIAEYLHEIIRNDTVTEKEVLKARMKYFLPELLEHSFLWEHKVRRNEPSAMQKMLGNFFGYWTMASGLVGFHQVDPKKEEKFRAVVERENLVPFINKGHFADLLVVFQRIVSRKIHLRHTDLSGADLSGADLRVADLSGADLRVADLNGADLSGADLSGAYLRVADLSGADLRVADLNGADLSGADLRGADLSVADLSGADLSGAYLRVADFSNAIFWKDGWTAVNFEDARMEEVKGLETAIGLEKANFKGTLYEGKFSKEK